jgi:phosphomethylpyrimidine synthase
MHNNKISDHMCVMQTLIQECVKGVPPLVSSAAREEGISPRTAARSIARGRMVIPANPVRSHRICAIGEGCRIKVNVNIGTSGERCDESLEMDKAQAALQNGADTLMDLSTGGNLAEMRRKLLELDSPVGTVPIYEAVRRAGNAADVDADLLFKVIREHCKDGVDFLTLHCGVNMQALDALKTDPRIMDVVSRGGAFHVAMMASRGEENPLYSEFDYLLEIVAEEGVVISLGDGMRPGCLQDSDRHAKTVEYLTLGALASRALSSGVQRMIEGPGHVPLTQIGYNVQFLKELTSEAPLYLLGPIVTDLSPGYDHVVSAIGGTIACTYGADFLCMVSPSEHLALPSVADIIEGTRVCRIAAHIGNMSRIKEGYRSAREIQMAEARKRLDWDEQFRVALFGDTARQIHERDGSLDTCSMCGDLCAMKMVADIFHKRPEKR